MFKIFLLLSRRVCGAHVFLSWKRRPSFGLRDSPPGGLPAVGEIVDSPLSLLVGEHIEKLKADFQPPRGRFKAGALEAASVAAQRSGDSVLPLIPADCTPDTALSLAAAVNPFDFSLFANFSAAILRDSSANIAVPGDVPVFRERVAEHLAQVNRALRHLAKRRRAALPLNAPNAHLNLALLCFLLNVYTYSDASLCCDLSAGMHIQGVIPFFPALAPRFSPASQSRESMAQGLFRRNKRFARPLARSGRTVEAGK